MVSKRTFSVQMLFCTVLVLPFLTLEDICPNACAIEPAKRKQPFSWAIEDDPSLPRVLLLGDSISIDYTLKVRDLLKNNANVHRPLASANEVINCGSTQTALDNLDMWLGEKPWDVIHFNFGLHDLKYVDEKGQRVRCEKGKQNISLDQYKKNLRALVKKLKKTNAKLIWASTTPVPEREGTRISGDEVKYNAVAEKVMTENEITINDLYSYTISRIKEIQMPWSNVHFTPQGCDYLAERVASVIAQFCPPQQMPQVKLYKTIGDVKLSLHIFEPQNRDKARPLPAVVFFFGGGWVRGTVKQFYPQSRYLASRGMVAVCAEYRIKNIHGTTPLQCVADGKSAVRWIRANAKKLGVDPNKIAAAGGSAGGHIAACTALVKRFDEKTEDLDISSRPNLLVLFNPAVDPSNLTDRFGQYAKDLSPMHQVKKGISPTIIFHGTADTVVPFEDAKRFCDLMKKAGNVCELVSFEGREHAFFNYDSDQDHSSFRQTIRLTDEFLRKWGFLKGKPAI